MASKISFVRRANVFCACVFCVTVSKNDLIKCMAAVASAENLYRQFLSM